MGGQNGCKSFLCYIFVQPLELKLNVCPYFNSDLMSHRANTRMPSTEDCYGWVVFPVAQLVEHGPSNAKIMGSIPRESKSW